VPEPACRYCRVVQVIAEAADGCDREPARQTVDQQSGRLRQWRVVGEMVSAGCSSCTGELAAEWPGSSRMREAVWLTEPRMGPGPGLTGAWQILYHTKHPQSGTNHYHSWEFPAHYLNLIYMLCAKIQYLQFAVSFAVSRKKFSSLATNTHECDYVWDHIYGGAYCQLLFHHSILEQFNEEVTIQFRLNFDSEEHLAWDTVFNSEYLDTWALVEYALARQDPLAYMEICDKNLEHRHPLNYTCTGEL
jgi:hypothetical protein